MNEDENRFEGLVRRMEGNPAFWAWALLRHRQLTGLTEAGQAGLLHTSAEGLTTLAMCKAPRPDHREEDIAAVARRSGADPDALTAVLNSLQL